MHHMKKITHSILLSLAILTGCGDSSQNQLDYIGVDLGDQAPEGLTADIDIFGYISNNDSSSREYILTVGYDVKRNPTEADQDAEEGKDMQGVYHLVSDCASPEDLFRLIDQRPKVVLAKSPKTLKQEYFTKRYRSGRRLSCNSLATGLDPAKAYKILDMDFTRLVFTYNYYVESGLTTTKPGTTETYPLFYKFDSGDCFTKFRRELFNIADSQTPEEALPEGFDDSVETIRLYCEDNPVGETAYNRVYLTPGARQLVIESLGPIRNSKLVIDRINGQPLQDKLVEEQQRVTNRSQADRDQQSAVRQLFSNIDSEFGIDWIKIASNPLIPPYIGYNYCTESSETCAPPELVRTAGVRPISLAVTKYQAPDGQPFMVAINTSVEALGTASTVERQHIESCDFTSPNGLMARLGLKEAHNTSDANSTKKAESWLRTISKGHAQWRDRDQKLGAFYCQPKDTEEKTCRKVVVDGVMYENEFKELFSHQGCSASDETLEIQFKNDLWIAAGNPTTRKAEFDRIALGLSPSNPAILSENFLWKTVRMQPFETSKSVGLTFRATCSADCEPRGAYFGTYGDMQNIEIKDLILKFEVGSDTIAQLENTTQGLRLLTEFNSSALMRIDSSTTEVGRIRRTLKLDSVMIGADPRLVDNPQEANFLIENQDLPSTGLQVNRMDVVCIDCQIYSQAIALQVSRADLVVSGNQGNAKIASNFRAIQNHLGDAEKTEPYATFIANSIITGETLIDQCANGVAKSAYTYERPQPNNAPSITVSSAIPPTTCSAPNREGGEILVKDSTLNILEDTSAGINDIDSDYVPQFDFRKDFNDQVAFRGLDYHVPFSEVKSTTNPKQPRPALEMINSQVNLPSLTGIGLGSFELISFANRNASDALHLTVFEEVEFKEGQEKKRFDEISPFVKCNNDINFVVLISGDEQGFPAGSIQCRLFE